MVHRSNKTLDLVYFNAGGGHRAAATALETVIRSQGRPWTVRPVNLMHVLDPKHVFRKTTGMEWEDIYNTRLARGWSMGLSQELKLLQAFIRFSHRSTANRLKRHWRKTRPDLVVSLIPNFNRIMYEGLTAANLGAPYVTVLTDFADLPPHFWIEPKQDQHFICGTPKAVLQARDMGYGADRIHATSGMIIRPDFYDDVYIDRRAELKKLGLDPDRPTGLVMFGGHGSRVMQGIARRLPDTQLIMICGHNAVLAERLRAMTAAAAAVRAARHPGIHPGDPLLHAIERFLHRQAGTRQHQRSRPAGSAGDRDGQRLDHAAGALQHRVGAGEPRRHRSRFVPRRARGRRGDNRSSRRVSR